MKGYSAILAAFVASVSFSLADNSSSKAPSSYGLNFLVNVPSVTAEKGKGHIFMQLQAPAENVSWFALGQGTGMKHSNMFVVYAASKDNITLSPRSGTGHSAPKFNPDAQVSLLDGTGIKDGKVTANIRCDNCLSWQNGTGHMDPKSKNSSWIWAYRKGDPLNTDNPSAGIKHHSDKGRFTWDLTKATGGDSSNPFAKDSESAKTSDGPPTFPRNPDSKYISVHGVIMSVVFLFLFPVFALSLHVVPLDHVATRIHAPFQALTLCLAIAGFGLGIYVMNSSGSPAHGHQVLGILVVVILIAFQPLLGFLQHRHFVKASQRGMSPTSAFGYAHRYLGRIAIFLGIFNGWLGFHQRTEDSFGFRGTTVFDMMSYVVVAVGIGVLYVIVVSLSRTKAWLARELRPRTFRQLTKRSLRGASPLTGSPAGSINCPPASVRLNNLSS
ncbi:hypothetical protein KEM55_007524 [Ascosphaera atra]|nr:hypothetical protein KEM55_007524 [Ascosphaera atra]